MGSAGNMQSGADSVDLPASASHRHRFRVLFGDTDQMGVVYYANYLRYFEAGRNELLRHLGLPYLRWEAEGVQLPVIEASVRYRRPARYDDELELKTTVSAVGRTRVSMAYELFRVLEGRLEERLVTGATSHAAVSAAGKPIRLPDRFRRVLGVAGGEDG